MGLFSSSLNKNRVEILCDIGNGSIGVALVSYSLSGEKPTILFNERIFSVSKEQKGLMDILVVMDKNLKTLLTKALSHSASFAVKPVRVSCFYSSPWYISETNVLKIKQSEPIIFSELIIKKALDEAEKGFLSNDVIKNDQLVDEDIRLIERKITRIKLNGYQTHNPIGKKASDLEVSIFLSAVPQNVLFMLEETIDKFWHKIKVEHHSFPIASFSMLRNEFDPQGTCLIVHVAENITDIFLVNDERLLDTFSFPLGNRNIIRSIEDKCGLDYEIASSALSMYSKDEIHLDQVGKIRESIEFAKKDWMAHFQNACSTLTKQICVPSTVYLMSDLKTASFFESIIRNSSFDNHVMFDKELKVYTMEQNIFNKYILYKYSSHKDFFLETEILYVNLISNNKEKIIDNYTLE